MIDLVLNTESSQDSRMTRLGKVLLSMNLTDILSEIIEHAKKKFSMFGLLLVALCYFIVGSLESHLKMADSIILKARRVFSVQRQKNLTKKFLC